MNDNQCDIIEAEIAILKARKSALSHYVLNKDFGLECRVIDYQMENLNDILSKNGRLNDTHECSCQACKDERAGIQHNVLCRREKG